MTKEEPFLKPDQLTLAGIFLTVIYVLWIVLAVGWRSDHYIFLGSAWGLYLLSPLTRKIAIGLFLFAVYWVIYDSMRVFPNYEFNHVYIRELYELEKRWFGFSYQGRIITPNEYFAMNLHPVADFLAGLFYLCWVPVPMAFATLLFFKDRRLLLDFSFAFLLTNIFGFILYYAFPAAAPWYVELYGFEQKFNIPGHEAGLANFDRIIGIPLFSTMYVRNSNVFAAIPSLHAAYPLITFYFCLRKKWRILQVLFFVIMIGIWLAAVYTRHHYIIDVLLGILCALTTLAFYEKILLKTKFRNWMQSYEALVR